MKKLSIRNILVPIDFSKISVQAVETAKALAQRSGATIHLAHVHHWQYPADFMGPVISTGFLPQSFDEHQNKLLADELKSVANKAGLMPRDRTHLRTGTSAFHEICKLAREIPADLIVMPTHGYTGLKHVLLGSIAERVVQHAPCPVFIVRESGNRLMQKKRDFKRILVPVDFSRGSREGLNYAIEFAREFEAKLILVHATYLGYIYSCDGTAIYDVPGLQKAARKSAEGQMQKLVRSAKFGPVKFETVFTEGSPVLDICDFAKDHDADLIITSTHGLTGFEHVLIGSIAEKVVRHAPCSVLVIPSHPKVRKANLVKTSVIKTGVGTGSQQRILPGVRRTRLQEERQKSPKGRMTTKRDRKLVTHAFPERRQTNKFRESHFSR
jgi:nucleotide-binding universal stress UspA family protein